MNRYRVEISISARHTVEVDAEDEDFAMDLAHARMDMRDVTITDIDMDIEDITEICHG